MIKASPTKVQTKLTSTIGLAGLLSSNEQDLQKVNASLLQCPDCSYCDSSGKQTSNITPLGIWNSRYLVIECANNACGSEWSLCIECGPKQRSRIITSKQLKDHTSNNHSNKKRRRVDAVQQEIDLQGNQEGHEEADNDDIAIPDADNDEELEAELDNNDIDWIDVVDSENLGFLEAKSKAYFQQCYLGAARSAGRDYLVLRSSRRSDLQSSEYATQHVPPGHGELQARIANLAFILTRGQTESLVKVLQGSYRVGCEDGYACMLRKIQAKIELLNRNGRNDALELLKQDLKADVFRHNLVDQGAHIWSTTIPATWNDIRNHHLEGARSILANLPVPVIKKDIQGHSYVSVEECIRHFLGHRDLSDIATIPKDIQEKSLESVNHSSVSLRAREIFQETSNESPNPVTSYILFWSDDVEPNRTKANRGSVWLLTATIATHLENGHSLQNTFPIAVGRKGDDHDPVVAKVEQEMRSLRSNSCPPFYIGMKKKKVRIAFELFCTLQDQPERRDFNSIRGGNAATTGRFGVSADHNALYQRNVLPACRECLQRMETALQQNNFPWPMAPCNECVRWDALDDANSLAYWVAPKEYPETGKVFDRDVNIDGKVCQQRCLRPFRITYESLRTAVDTAHQGYVEEGWSQSNCESFLEVEGMSTKYINIVLEHCARSFTLKVAKANPTKYQSVLDAAASNPAAYRKAPYPSPWLRPTVPLELHPDVIMHLMFLGVVKTTVTQIQNCLSAQSKLASFLKSTEGYLSEFQHMSLEWISIQPYQAGRMGGWVSENFLGFSRIMPWFFQNIDAAVEITTDFSPPDDLPQKKWLHRHNLYWLNVRGLSTKGNKEELRERVARAIEQGAPEPLAAPQIPTASVEAVLLALMEVLQCVMATTVTPALVNRTRYAIRVFLSKYDSLCRPLRQKTPAVLSSYNFICLLNLPDVMEKFGPLRSIWEGGPQGEGFVRFGKPLMTQGLRQNWYHQLLRKMHCAISFISVLDAGEKAPKFKVQDKDALRALKGMFRLYKSAFDLTLCFSRNRSLATRNPVSVVLVQDTAGVKIYSVIRTYDEIIRIVGNLDPPIQCFGLDYYSFDIDQTHLENGGIRWTDIAGSITKIAFGLLLPLLRVDDEENRFALISWNWKSLSPSVPLSNLLED